MNNKFLHLKNMRIIAIILFIGLMVYSCSDLSNLASSKLSYANISVPEEGGINFVKITEDADAVAVYSITSPRKLSALTSASNFSWWVNPIIAISPDGKRIAYINNKNSMMNIMEKSATSGGLSVQRTFRNMVTDFSWTPDGKKFCFTEYRNKHFGTYLIDAEQSSVVRQISSGSTDDFAPVMSSDGKHIYFHRSEGGYIYSLWSFDIDKNLFSNYSRGMTPCLIPGKNNLIYCTRYTEKREIEIWKVNTENGVEEILLSQPDKSFSTPKLSPDGQWILCTGTSITPGKIQNTDIFVVRVDGTGFTQLTYHSGNDLSAIWSPDGKSIFFASQRGSQNGAYNIWKMDFNL